jgi:hypothetical protein
LRNEWLAIPSSVQHAGGVHGFLERVSLPAEDVINVSSVALAVASAPNKWLRAVHGPVGFVVELSCIPESLIGELEHANGMRSWARIGRGKDHCLSQYRTCDVFLVVGAVEVLLILASSYFSE